MLSLVTFMTVRRKDLTFLSFGLCSTLPNKKIYQAVKVKGKKSVRSKLVLLMPNIGCCIFSV